MSTTSIAFLGFVILSIGFMFGFAYAENRETEAYRIGEDDGFNEGFAVGQKIGYRKAHEDIKKITYCKTGD